MKEPKNLTALDLFCGAGGASEGMRQAGIITTMAINHDPGAIESHSKNHPNTIHLIEDIRTVAAGKIPKVDLIWMSAECTHYSIAKGGAARDADSRTLSEELIRYAVAADPSYILVENVKEFLSWGPLDEKGKPLSKNKGRDYLKWVRSICKLGYNYDFRLLNSADFGAYTSRVRYFGIFAKDGFPIKWPRQSHSKNPGKSTDLFKQTLKPWNPVRDILDLEDTGESILYGRIGKKPLSPNTLKRIEYGLNRYKDESGYIDTYQFRNPIQPISETMPTIVAHRDSYLVTPMLLKYYTGGRQAIPVSDPMPAITTKDRFAYCSVTWNTYFLSQDYGRGHNTFPISRPLSSITTKPKQKIVQMLTQEYGGPASPSSVYNNRSLEQPAPSITSNPKSRLVTSCQKGEGNKMIIRRWSPPMEILPGTKVQGAYLISEGIIDIRMRMLKVAELKKAQGFPDNYILTGGKTKQKKYIGNSVVPLMAKLLTEAIAHQIPSIKEILVA